MHRIKALLEGSRYLMVAATMILMIVAFFAMFWGLAKAISAITLIVSTLGESHEIEVALIRVVDAFLISIVLYLFAVSIYELFIGGLSLPVAKNLNEMKIQLSGVIVMVMAVEFVEHLLSEKPSIEQLYLAGSIALVAAVLLMLGAINRRAK